MISIEQMNSVLKTLPDPAFILTRNGKYVAVFGGRDTRYYHDGSTLVGSRIADIIKTEKANWFLEKIDQALQSKQLIIEEYELSGKDVIGLPDEGPKDTIWFEGRIQSLDFLVEDEEVVLWVASNISQRHEQEIKLRELGDTDQLTGFFNRRRLERDLISRYETFMRYATPTSVLIFDLDNLKHINDTLGHHSGDDAILAVVNTCRIQLRSTDTAYRFGGDEFIIALPNIDLKQAVKFADRLRECFNLQRDRLSIDGIFATVSIGVTTMLPTDKSYEDALKRADHALYEAKYNGKNKVVIA
ncbi:MAG: GGDEF domain-containing protein [Sulfurospirillaceae bacterium]|nr:GGDEF domain-containing protein [Sulfurospirillaceae bacterium]